MHPGETSEYRSWQLRQFRHIINPDKVFGTHNRNGAEVIARSDQKCEGPRNGRPTVIYPSGIAETGNREAG
jgi:hypothetical protein